MIYQVAAATPPATGSAPPITVNGGDKVMLNFVGADVHEVVSSVLGDTLKINYSIDPKVTGTVTFRTMSPIPKADLLGLLEDMLALSGAAMVPRGGGYDIIPLDQAAKMPAILQGNNGRIGFDPGFGIHIIPVHFASPDNLNSVAEPLLPPGRLLFIDAPHHLLMYVGTSSEAADVADLISTLDVDPMAGKSFALFPVKYSDPTAVASELRMILVPAGSGAAANLRPGRARRPDERHSGDHLPARLSRPGPRMDQPARPWRRDDAAPPLCPLCPERPRGGARPGAAPGAGHLRRRRSQEASNPVAPGMVQSTGQRPGHGRQCCRRPGRRIRRRDADAWAAVLPAGLSAASNSGAIGQGNQAGLGGSQGTGAYGGQGQGSATGDTGDTGSSDSGGSGTDANGGATDQLRIVSDVRNNALIIYANPKEYELIDQAMQRLDVVPLQVLIEATIAEVTLNNQLQYGLQWFFNSGDSSFAFSTLTSGAVSSVFPGFNYVLNATSAKVVLSALTQITQVKVISSPELLVLDNGTAHLEVGDQVPIVTQSAVSVISPGAPVVNSVDYRDTGVILNITPRVSSSGLGASGHRPGGERCGEDRPRRPSTRRRSSSAGSKARSRSIPARRSRSAD